MYTTEKLVEFRLIRASSSPRECSKLWAIGCGRRHVRHGEPELFRADAARDIRRNRLGTWVSSCPIIGLTCERTRIGRNVSGSQNNLEQRGDTVLVGRGKTCSLFAFLHLAMTKIELFCYSCYCKGFIKRNSGSPVCTQATTKLLRIIETTQNKHFDGVPVSLISHFYLISVCSSLNDKYRVYSLDLFHSDYLKPDTL